MGDALDVAVDGHQRQPEREQQQHRRGLLADAVDPGEPVARLERGHVAQELERVVAALLANPPERRLDPRRLLVGQAARPDGVDQLGERCALHRIPVGRRAVAQPEAAPAGSRPVRLDDPVRGIPPAKRLERHFRVRVRAVLGQDRQDELAGGVQAALPGGPSVVGGELVEHVAHEPGPIALETPGPGPPGIGEPPLARAGRATSERGARPPSRRPPDRGQACQAFATAFDRGRPRAHGRPDRSRSLGDRDGDRANRGQGLDPRGLDAAADRDALDTGGGRPPCDAERRLAERRLGVDPAFAGDDEVGDGEPRPEVGRLHQQLDARAQRERVEPAGDGQQAEADATRGPGARDVADEPARGRFEGIGVA